MRVVDASAIVELVLATPTGAHVHQELAGQRLYAPQLIHTEVVSALARQVRAGALPTDHADRALTSFLRMPIRLTSHHRLTERCWRLRDRVRVTDAFYVACTEGLGCPLVTCDGRLARAPLPGVRVTHVQ